MERNIKEIYIHLVVSETLKRALIREINIFFYSLYQIILSCVYGYREYAEDSQ